MFGFLVFILEEGVEFFVKVVYEFGECVGI